MRFLRRARARLRYIRYILGTSRYVRATRTSREGEADRLCVEYPALFSPLRAGEAVEVVQCVAQSLGIYGYPRFSHPVWRDVLSRDSKWSRPS